MLILCPIVYMKPSMLEALDKWGQLAELQGCPKAELAYRWVYHNSALRLAEGDFLIIGASTVKQITQTVEGVKSGPLKPEVVKGIDEIWELVKAEATVNNYEHMSK